jgi:hypothetical protein
MTQSRLRFFTGPQRDQRRHYQLSRGTSFDFRMARICSALFGIAAGQDHNIAHRIVDRTKK